MKTFKLKILQNTIKKGVRYSPDFKLKWRVDKNTVITDILDRPERFTYLKSDTWKAVKKAWWKEWYNMELYGIKGLDNVLQKRFKVPYCYCCLISNIALQLHHLSYRWYYGKEKFKNLIPLCNSCHKKLHKFAREIEKFQHGSLALTRGGKTLYSITVRFLKNPDQPIGLLAEKKLRRERKIERKRNAKKRRQEKENRQNDRQNKNIIPEREGIEA